MIGGRHRKRNMDGAGAAIGFMVLIGIGAFVLLKWGGIL